jgi:hypothetical protein
LWIASFAQVRALLRKAKGYKGVEKRYPGSSAETTNWAQLQQSSTSNLKNRLVRPSV